MEISYSRLQCKNMRRGALCQFCRLGLRLAQRSWSWWRIRKELVEIWKENIFHLAASKGPSWGLTLDDCLVVVGESGLWSVKLLW